MMHERVEERLARIVEHSRSRRDSGLVISLRDTSHALCIIQGGAMKQIRIVHYLNQFFAGTGGEERANLPVSDADGAGGPGRRLQQLLGQDGTIVRTVYAGDNYISEHAEAARAAVRDLLTAVMPDVVVAGPAFDAGRYGVAC